MIVAPSPASVAKRVTRRGLVLGGRWALIVVRAHGDRLRWMARERFRRAVDPELLQAHLGVADALQGLVLRAFGEPAAPAVVTPIRGHRRVVVGAVALLVSLDASLGLFKARSACN